MSRHHEDYRWLWGLRLKEKKEFDSNSANEEDFSILIHWNGQGDMADEQPLRSLRNEQEIT